jgi:hypothetical protein
MSCPKSPCHCHYARRCFHSVSLPRIQKCAVYLKEKSHFFTFFVNDVHTGHICKKNASVTLFLVLFSKKSFCCAPATPHVCPISLPKIRKTVAIIEEKQKIAHHSTPLFTKNGMGVEPKNPISEKNSLFSPSLHESNRYPTSCISNQFWRLVRLFRFFYENLCVLI